MQLLAIDEHRLVVERLAVRLILLAAENWILGATGSVPKTTAR